MALRILLLPFLLAAHSLTAQRLTLALYDVSWSGSGPAISNEHIVDSLLENSIEPSFHPEKPLLLYTVKSDTGSTILGFEYLTGGIHPQFSSKSSLTHPEVVPISNALSFIARGDKALYKNGSGAAKSVLPGKPMTNYIWVDDNTLFIISAGEPAKLEMMTVRPARTLPVATNVGSSIVRYGGGFAFIHKLSVDTWVVKQIKTDGRIEILAETRPGVIALAGSSSGKIMLVQEGNLFFLKDKNWKVLKSPVQAGDGEIKSAGLDASGNKLFILFARP